MALTLEDPEVDRLAEALSERLQTTKTAAIRHALEQTLSAEEAVTVTSTEPAAEDDIRKKAFIAKGLAIGRALREKAGAVDPKAADKVFIDSLYEDNPDVR